MNPMNASKPVLLQNVKIEDDFWSEYAKRIREVVIPYQYETLNDRVPGVEPSHAIRNFRIAAGVEEGEFGGFVFQDSDLAKWLEAVAYVLTTHPDETLERLADEVIDLIEAAQQPDGYVNTYFTIKEPDKRWTNLTDCHELYCAGHMIEAAVAYYRATGKKKLLDVMCRFADYIGTVFGEEEGKLKGYDGHQEIELALVKLYQATGSDRYLRLSQYFIDQRGQAPHFFLEEWERRGRTSHWRGGPQKPPQLSYFQSHLPVREQETATGHAVRAVYMYTAMADLAAHTGDESLLQACRKLWSNIVRKQMYITGGIGSTHHGEAFTFDYDLPNDTVYAETCASIGLIFFASRMLRLEAKGEYADAMERALYNTVIAGMARDGKHFFYVNPLEVWPEASRHNPGKHHVKPTRPGWFACACCPPNVSRLIASLGEYMYTANGRTAFVHLYIGGEAAVELDHTTVTLTQETRLPWEGSVNLRIAAEAPAEFTIAMRIPAWSRTPVLRVNGEAVDVASCLQDGYAYIRRLWKAEDWIELEFHMEIQLIRSHPRVRANAGKVAIQRGPLVYALEATDNGAPLASLCLDKTSPMTARFDAELLGGAIVIEGRAMREEEASWGDYLYEAKPKTSETIPFKAIPYFLWGNRGEGEMTVWVRE
ncbi:glycoside hydrolase family 127 protein [Paenibacillus allorhizosphaerae]|uniref:Non-reducing end beta-L-arabinofuranosidase n=1 Tax=Paenibacillus allorhizosphaerae TaxID=2849866 RepID=A0ABN7TKZ7_9BACL|nr:beta-L-arabinofuranosidase domain-containing protein [Paenibacillus allorhizosphaerae]CAG7644867.1 Non-reducing end beta-L-arabinofuranosidase [Paenibacillus allorhizosphaerae]